MAARPAAVIPAVIALVAGTAAVAKAGYGDAAAGRPTAEERCMTVATNMVRADPRGFRDAYVGVDTILLAENFPATHPLYHYAPLDEAARLHAEDMAANHGLSHTSSDGTSFNDRVTSYYAGWNCIGENVATGVADGLGTVVQLLRDDVYPTDHPAPDSSDDDGHRRNIMAPYFEETGAGYAYGPDIQWHHFWCQDLGRRFTAPAGTRIPAGAHFVLDTGTVSFTANYYDAGGNAPQAVSVVVDGTPYAMALHLGTSSNGTWRHDRADDGYRARYWFECVDAAGDTARYPATDTLYANPDADDPPSAVNAPRAEGTDGPSVSVRPFPATRTSVITVAGPARIRIFDCQGRLVRETDARHTVPRAFTDLSPGIYRVQAVTGTAPPATRTVPVVR